MTRIPDKLRRLVLERANYCCEYCRYPLVNDFVQPEADHIIPEKHRGKTTEDNLCSSCIDCNRHKGSDFGSFDPETDEIAFLYNPRKDKWDEHFRLNEAMIEPLTPTGRVTVFVLQLNDPKRLLERSKLIRMGQYPCRLA